MNAILRVDVGSCNLVVSFALLLSSTFARAEPATNDWLPGDDPYVARAGIGTFDELLTAVDTIANEGRAWRDGLANHTAYVDDRLEELAGQLWTLSGSGKPLANEKPFEIAGHWENIVEEYRALTIDGRAQLSFADFLKKNMKTSLEPLGGARSPQASNVFNYWIRSAVDPTEEMDSWRLAHEGLDRSQGSLPYRDQPTLRQTAKRDQWTKWYEDLGTKMRWDADRKQFTNDRGEGLRFADPEEFPKFLAAAERKAGVQVGSTNGKRDVIEKTSPAQKAPRDPVPEGKPTFPVIYSSREKPGRLDVEQVAAVEKIAKETMPQGRQIWFVYVCSEKRQDAEPEDAGDGLVVYYTPDHSTKRLRTGRYARIGWLGRTAFLNTYADVSDPEHDFDVKPSVPTEAHLPFARPARGVLSDAQLIQVVDQVREKTDEPILHIAFQFETLECKTGWIGGPLNGSGSLFAIEKHNDGSVTVGERGIWVS